MSWQPELDELERRRAFAKQMGGADKVKRQHDGGRLTVRERIDGLLDAGSFQEVGTLSGIGEYDPKTNELTGVTPANCVFGRGTVDGRSVVVVGDDFTVRGGSADASISAKPLMAEDMAGEFRLPIVRIIEGSGGGGSVKTIETKGAANLPGGVGGTRGFYMMTANLAQVPVVARLGQPLTKQELGGTDIQTRSGAIDNAVETEAEAFEQARRFLSYLPSSVHELPPITACSDDPERTDEKLLSVIPRNRRQIYKVRPIIESVVDQGSFFEMGRNFGRSIVAGLARFNGHPVVLFASDPYINGGSWNAETCQKVVRFADLAETFHLPVVYLMDCPGFLIGLEAEKTATIRHGVRAMAAMNQTSIPWCTVIMRNAYGVAGAAHQPGGRLSLRYAWPSASWGSLPLEGGIEAAYRADIDAADDKAAKMKEIEDRLNALRSPYRTAEKFWVEEIVDPRKTRELLCDFVKLAWPALNTGRARLSMRP
ncbi:MAG: acyl-CoA carboxylase subunit beta [Burkholderiales bacterium]